MHRFVPCLRLFVCSVLASVSAGVAIAQGTFLVSTLAGESSAGSADGTGDAARFNQPMALALDADGNLLVADSFNHTIRKVTPGGVVTTIAGRPGHAGSVDAAGAQARLERPTGITRDSAGNFLIADTLNHTIRRLTPSGTVTTFAGAADVLGSADGSTTDARFEFPRGIAADGSGNVYVTSMFSGTVRRITPGGTVSKIAGPAHPTNPGSLLWPNAVTTTPTGDVVVLSLLSPELIRRAAGSASWEKIADAPLSTGLTTDPVGGGFFASNALVVYRIAPNGTVTVVAGRNDQSGSADGPGSQATFTGAWALAADASGNVYVADTGNLIRRIAADGTVSTIAGLSPQRAFQTVNATGRAARFRGLGHATYGPGGDLFVAETHGGVIRRVTTSGTASIYAGTPHGDSQSEPPPNSLRLGSPFGIAFEPGGHLYVSDPGDHTIRRVSPDGIVAPFASNVRAYGLAVDASGALFAAVSHQILRFSPHGEMTVFAGGASAGFVDGPAGTARFNFPRALAFDAAGNLYVNDFNNRAVRKITPAGDVSTLATHPDFRQPEGIAVDPAGNVLLVDEAGAVHRITPSGAVSRLAGLLGETGHTDGLAVDAQFNRPVGIAVNAVGRIAVADYSTIRLIESAAAPIIATQPASLSVQVGGTAQLSVVATGSPSPSYQWQRNGVAIAGATGATLTLPNAQSADAGEYRVVVSNILGQVTSTVATLAVNAAPSSPPSTGGGGGGAPSLWFIAAVIALSAARLWRHRVRA